MTNGVRHSWGTSEPAFTLAPGVQTGLVSTPAMRRATGGGAAGRRDGGRLTTASLRGAGLCKKTTAQIVINIQMFMINLHSKHGHARTLAPSRAPSRACTPPPPPLLLALTLRARLCPPPPPAVICIRKSMSIVLVPADLLCARGPPLASENFLRDFLRIFYSCTRIFYEILGTSRTGLFA